MTRIMKDSGIEWIGEIPTDWEVVKVKEYYNFEKGKNASKYKKETLINNGTYPVYSGQTENDGILGYLNHYEYYKQAILITTVGANVMTTNILNGKYSLSQNCVLATPKSLSTNIHYINYILILLFRYEKTRIPNYMQPSLRIEDLNKYKIVSPSLQEQEKIASILDEKVARIDAIIADTKQSIEELKKYKQSLITETVTKGLDKDVPMKDSGIEWIGKIPENWEVKRIGNYFYKVKNPNHNLVETNLLSLSYGNIIQKDINTNDGLLPKNFETYNIVLPDDIVLRMTDLQNDHKSLRTGLVGEKGIITSAYITLRVKNSNQINAAYLQKVLYTFDIKKGFYGMGNGVRQGVNFSDIKKMDIIIPPLSEQNQIVEFLDIKTEQIDQLIQGKEELIAQYEVYKKSMIYEYVTGKREI